MRRSFSSLLFLAGGACAAFGGLATASRRAREARTASRRSARQPVASDPPPLPSHVEATKPDPAKHRDAAARERVDALSRRKQDFLGMLSHELRNPLSAIHVALAVMRARENMHAGQQARTVIERQVAHIARLVEDLVDSARIERGTLSLQLEAIDLRDVLHVAVEMAQPSVAHRRQRFVWDRGAAPMPVIGDRVRLQQVFSNLLLNASKYTPEQGEVVLTTYQEGSDFCVAVRDTGKGIAEEDLSRVFEPFVRATRDVPGLGVGLYVARTLVEQHGGEIAVQSVGAGHGATFTVRLPERSPLFRDAGLDASPEPASVP